MDRQNRKIIVLIVLVLILIFTLFGCKSKDISEEDEELGRNVTTNIGTKGTNKIVDKAESIADDVVDLIGVENATVVMYNEQAVIVVELSEDVDFSNEIKETIKKIALKNESKLKSVIISNNAKLFDKVDNIAQNLIKGEDIKEYSQEINKIIKNIEKENKDN